MRIGKLSLAVALSALVPASAASAASIVTDFLTSPSQANPQGDGWRYYTGIDTASRTGSYTLLPLFDTAAFVNSSGVEAWVNSTDGANFLDIVGVGKNTNGVTTVDVPPGGIYMHPAGAAAGAVSTSYLIATTGIYSVAVTLADLATGTGFGSDGIQWFLDRNSSAGNLASGTIANAGAAQGYSNALLSLTAGDELDLIVSSGALNNAAFDTTGITFTINQIPEPASLSLLGLVIPMFMRRRRA